MNTYHEAVRRYRGGGFPTCEKCGAPGHRLALVLRNGVRHWHCDECGQEWEYPTDAELAKRLMLTVEALAKKCESVQLSEPIIGRHYQTADELIDNAEEASCDTLD